MWWLSVATLVISSTVSNEKEQVINLFHRKANFENTIIHDTIGMETPWRYRNKSQIPVGKMKIMMQSWVLSSKKSSNHRYG